MEPSVTYQVTVTVNGQRRTARVDPRTSVLDLLRERLRLTGAKKGCDHGQCGACTVLADGRRVNACLALAVAYDGARLTTVEGLAPGELHPLQQAFIDPGTAYLGGGTNLVDLMRLGVAAPVWHAAGHRIRDLPITPAKLVRAATVLAGTGQAEPGKGVQA